RKGNTVRNRLLACLMPVVFNAVIVGAVITWAYEGQNIFEHPGLYAVNAAWVGLGEAGVLYLIGYTLMRQLPKLKFFREFIEKCNRK
ncbi:MAG: QueT transporter family protein, partial [Oscillospiraceae bacterium]|nr:QueT transporter family protein [Oscillospiraceae bacterium]